MWLEELLVNNSSLAAITTSIHYVIPLEGIVVLSLGTGFNPSSLDSSVYGKGNWGVYQWAPYLIGLLMDANTEAITYQSQILLNDSYCRINPMLSTSVGLGDASAIPDLKKIGDEFDLRKKHGWKKFGELMIPRIMNQNMKNLHNPIVLFNKIKRIENFPQTFIFKKFMS